MTEPLPPGQGPIDPQGAFSPPPPPSGGGPQSGPRYSPPPMPPGPPPGWFPPPPPPYYPPPRREKSFARAIFTTLATTIFSISLLMNIYLLAFSGVMEMQGSKQNVLIEGTPEEQVAVIDLNGVILGKSVEQFNRLLKRIEKDDAVKALVIRIDTPGGEVSASDQIYNRVKQFKSDNKIPVVITMGALATSGGYYVACAGDYVFAEPTTATGNIGVLWPNYNISKLCEKWGIEETTIHSTGADFKTAGSMFKPERAEDRRYMQQITDDLFVRFKKIVADGRKLKADQVEQIANGKIYLGEEAKSLGLIDQIGYADAAYSFAAQKAGLKNPHVVRFEDKPSMLDLFSAKAGQGSPRGSLNINLDAGLVEQMLSPRPMYLWRGE